MSGDCLHHDDHADVQDDHANVQDDHGDGDNNDDGDFIFLGTTTIFLKNKSCSALDLSNFCRLKKYFPVFKKF